MSSFSTMIHFVVADTCGSKLKQFSKRNVRLLKSCFYRARYNYDKVFIKSLNKLLHIIINYDNRVYFVLCTVLSSDSVSLCPLTRTNKHKKAVIKNQCNLGTPMIKLECWAPGSAQNFFGLRTPQPKKDQGSSQ